MYVWALASSFEFPPRFVFGKEIFAASFAVSLYFWTSYAPGPGEFEGQSFESLELISFGGEP